MKFTELLETGTYPIFEKCLSYSLQGITPHYSLVGVHRIEGRLVWIRRNKRLSEKSAIIKWKKGAVELERLLLDDANIVEFTIDYYTDPIFDLRFECQMKNIDIYKVGEYLHRR